ncbi:MAG TPA: hypothetical protein VKP65_06330 [Rhodothermales bacterium]|nr:hypothetical protein [Rhodothermales bacterium]
MSTEDVQYVSDEHGDLTGVVVPIALWREIISELETHHLLKSEAMKKRLLEARGRQDAIPFDEALEQLGMS